MFQHHTSFVYTGLHKIYEYDPHFTYMYTCLCNDAVLLYSVHTCVFVRVCVCVCVCVLDQVIWSNINA